MAHTTKEKLLNRVRRIKGQVSGIEKALENRGMLQSLGGRPRRLLGHGTAR